MKRSHSGFTRHGCALLLTWGMFAATACAGQQKGKVVEKSLDALSTEQRRAVFDTMAAALDRDPKLVDELYVVSREHPQMFVRFLANAARDLKEPALARTTGALLVSHPDSLAEVMRATLELAQQDPEARDALAKVMVEERVILADILTDHPTAMREIMNATLRATEQKPAAREALLASMRTSSDRVAEILVRDPKTVGQLMGAMLRAGVDRDVLREIFAD